MGYFKMWINSGPKIWLLKKLFVPLYCADVVKDHKGNPCPKV